MLCDQAQEMLADILGEELGSVERRAFDEHLVECEACRAEVASLEASADPNLPFPGLMKGSA